MPTPRPGTRVTNVPPQPLAWSLTRASREFGTPKTTLASRLKEAGENPDSSGLFSTRQITQALYGSLFAERVRLTREAADKVAMANKITAASVLSREALSAAFSQLADGLQQAVNNSGMDRRAREDFLHNLATLPLILENVAKAQTRLPCGKGKRDGNGQDTS